MQVYMHNPLCFYIEVKRKEETQYSEWNETKNSDQVKISSNKIEVAEVFFCFFVPPKSYYGVLSN